MMMSPVSPVYLVIEDKLITGVCRIPCYRGATGVLNDEKIQISPKLADFTGFAVDSRDAPAPFASLHTPMLIIMIIESLLIWDLCEVNISLCNTFASIITRRSGVNLQFV